MKKGKLYVVPVYLGDSDSANSVFPPWNLEVLNGLKDFVVENDKMARRFLKRVGYALPLQETRMELLNEHSKAADTMELLRPALDGNDMGLLSDAGCPGIADPGAELVYWAQDLGIEVIPLVGPSSILLALMGSGMNGQEFTFRGYLPVDKFERKKRLKELSALVMKENQTQIFIETPYRNTAMLDDIIKECNGNLRLCLACNLSQQGGWVKTLAISLWAKQKVDVHKKPCVFLLGR